jgi:hypothetical protein
LESFSKGFFIDFKKEKKLQLLIIKFNTMKKENTPLSRFARFLRNKTEKSKLVINELTHPRFIIETTDSATKVKIANSLLFLMYSQENELLFV